MRWESPGFGCVSGRAVKNSGRSAIRRAPFSLSRPLRCEARFTFRAGPPWRFLACCQAWPATAWQETHGGVRRVYVEPFATKAGADNPPRRCDRGLRKLPSVSVVADASVADLSLGGGVGLFSPRFPHEAGDFAALHFSDRVPDARRVQIERMTCRSYLVTPAAASEDISKELAKRIAKHLAEALSQPETPSTALVDSLHPRSH